MKNSKIEAVIFDLDGTVLDNEGEWEQAFAAVLTEHKLKPGLLLPNGWVHEPGTGLAMNWRRLLAANGKTDADLERKLTAQTVTKYSELKTRLSLREGTEDLVTTARELGWMTALSTGSSWYVVEKELEELGLMLAFDVTTTGEEVYMPKPDPEIFLLTAQKLEVDPKNCLVVEDAVAGVRAAKEVEMKVVALKSGYAPEDMLKAAGADQVVDDFSHLKPYFLDIK